MIPPVCDVIRGMILTLCTKGGQDRGNILINQIALHGNINFILDTTLPVAHSGGSKSTWCRLFILPVSNNGWPASDQHLVPHCVPDQWLQSPSQRSLLCSVFLA